MNFVKNMTFFEEPNYIYFKKLFRVLFYKMGF